jgi:hypothetical protein
MRPSPNGLKTAQATLARPVLGLFRLGLRRLQCPDAVPTFSAVTSRKFGGSTSGWRGAA